MTKQQFFILHQSGSTAIITARSLAGAIKKCGWPPMELISASHVIKSVARTVKYAVIPSLVVKLPDGVELTAPSMEVMNTFLQRLGYKAVKETSNMLNEAAGTFFIDADTPSYCDPGCEAYHSM